jgi:hypothetical protein
MKNGASLKRLIKERYLVEEKIPFLTNESTIRSSGFSTLCPREEVLCARLAIERVFAISPELNLIFQHGHGLHNQLQNEILPDIGVLYGKWKCCECGTLQGGPVDPQVDIESWATLRPDSCESCSGTEFRFHEADLVNEEYRITGHCDGFLRLPEFPDFGILEGKSIGKGTAWEVVNVPKLEHVIQLQLYLWLTGLNWGVVLYWQKDEFGMNAFIEHFVDRDEDTIDLIKQTLTSIWEGVAGGPLPDKICATSDCPRAKECVVREPCFGEA